MLRITAVAGGVLAACVLGTGIAAADDVEGGHCEYGDASLVIMPSCNTSNSDTPDRGSSLPILTVTSMPPLFSRPPIEPIP